MALTGSIFIIIMPGQKRKVSDQKLKRSVKIRRFGKPIRTSAFSRSVIICGGPQRKTIASRLEPESRLSSRLWSNF